MRIGGLHPCSLVDYPGQPAAVIFTQGCNFRCHYCHNPELVLPAQYTPALSWGQVEAFLKKRQGRLRAVCISGGEPTLYSDLPEMLVQIKAMGYVVKLDSNGTRPALLKRLIQEKLVDYVAMDLKAPLPDYEKVVGWKVAVSDLEQSITLLMRSGIPYEFRTTVVKNLTKKGDLVQIAKKVRGATTYYLQRFELSKQVNPAYAQASSYPMEMLRSWAQDLQAYVQYCGVR